MSFTEVQGRHTGERLSKYVLDVLVEFNLCEKLFCITSDNAGNMNKLMKFPSKRLRKRGVIWSAEENYISCLNHVINLAVQDFLKAIKGLPSVQDEIPTLAEKEDDDDEDDDDEDDDDEDDDDEDDDEEEDSEIDDDKDDKEGAEELLVDLAAVEAEDEYNDVEDDFAGTLKKLRGIAKVYDVAKQVTFSTPWNHFCLLQLLWSKLTGRKPIQVQFKRNYSNEHVYSTK